MMLPRWMPKYIFNCFSANNTQGFDLATDKMWTSKGLGYLEVLHRRKMDDFIIRDLGSSASISPPHSTGQIFSVS